MNIEEMPGYGYPTIAVWPEPWYETGLWIMHEYKLKPDNTLHWYSGYVRSEDGSARVDCHNDFQSAVATADLRNTELLKNILNFKNEPEFLQSLAIKATKAIQIKSRLSHEEQLMLKEAKKRGEKYKLPDKIEIDLGLYSNEFTIALNSQLLEFPYLKIVNVNRHIVYKIDERKWSRPQRATQKTARIAARAKIANGFGFLGTEHWGKTKAAIREILLPRANQLLQLASVQRLLAEALSRGERVLVSGGYVFWYEADGEIGWKIKQTESKEGDDGETIWKEGSILSKNHGRIVILPYIKESGEYIQGHTRNAPHDGPATPRHPNHYVELPFKILKDDLMVGLFGELPYE